LKKLFTRRHYEFYWQIFAQNYQSWLGIDKVIAELKGCSFL